MSTLSIEAKSRFTRKNSLNRSHLLFFLRKKQIFVKILQQHSSKRFDVKRKQTVLSLSSFLINSGALPSSVTRFGKISPLGRTFKNLGQTFEGICSGWQNFEQFWTIPNSQIMKNILVIWSHCCRLASSQGRYLWSSAWSGFDFAKVVAGKTHVTSR